MSRCDFNIEIALLKSLFGMGVYEECNIFKGARLVITRYVLCKIGSS